MVKKKPTPESTLPDRDDGELPLWGSLDPFPRKSEEIASILGLLRNIPLVEDLEPLRTAALDAEGDRRQESAKAALTLARRQLAEEPDVVTADAACNWLWLAAHCD